MDGWKNGWMDMSGDDAGAWKRLGTHVEADVSPTQLSASVCNAMLLLTISHAFNDTSPWKPCRL